MITVEELNKQIRGNQLQKAYFFFGEEDYLLENKIHIIIKKCVPPGLADFNVFKFEGKNTNFERLAEAVEQYPQMSEKKVVWVKNSGIFQNAAGREYKMAAELLHELPPYTCLIFEETAFDKKKIKNLKPMEEAGAVVEFSYLPVNRVEIWLEEKFKKAEKTILARDLTYMVRLCGQSLRKISIEYDKVIGYVGDRYKVTREDIDAVVDKSVEYRVYDMLDSIMNERPDKAQTQMKFLRDNNESPTGILSIMTGKMAELLLCKLLHEDGLPPKEILEYFDFKRPLFVVNKTIDESRRFGEKYLKRMIRLGLSYDVAVKTGKMDGWTAAELYLAELTLVK